MSHLGVSVITQMNGQIMPDITEIDMYDLQKLCRQYGLDIDVLNADLWDLRKELRWAGCTEVD